MPKLGDITTASKIGYKGRAKFIGIKDDNRPENLRLLNEHEHHPKLVTQELQKRLANFESRLILLEAENVLLKTVLQEIRDSIPDEIQNLRCYNTLGSLLDRQIEGIVQPLSNEDREQNRRSRVCRKLILRPSSEMTLKNPAKSVNPKSEIRYGNAELADSEMNRASVETLHGTPFGVKTKSDSHRKVSQIE